MSCPHTITAAAAIALLITTAHASAAVIIEWQPVDNSHVLDGYVTQDLLVTTEGDWNSAQLLIELDAGEIFYAEQGDRTPPNPDFFDAFPALEFDTYLAAGEGSNPSIAGGAVDLGGESEESFEDQLLDAAWFTTTTGLSGEILLGRVTLSDDASGTWSIRIGAGGEALFMHDVPVRQGVLIPEPASAVLLAAAALILPRRRRHRHI